MPSLIRKNVAGQRVGLLGGSFNPAHEGHLHITRLALERLCLDRVWWLVSPQNPLKSPRDMAPLDRRVRVARAIADDPRIIVTDMELELDTIYTVDTIKAVKCHYPDVHFVWIMGDDNLAQISRWKDWRTIFRLVPIAVFARSLYSFRVSRAKAARRFAGARIRRTRARSLAGMPTPAWLFLRTGRNPASATDIRSRTKS